MSDETLDDALLKDLVQNKIKRDIIDLHNKKKDEFLNDPADINLIENLSTWLFLYMESSDTLLHWKLFSKMRSDGKDLEDYVRSSTIRGGMGNIGYIAQSKRPDFVNNTFDDPRGTVSVEDELIENKSWLGIPIKNEHGNLVAVISFFVEKFYFWKEENKDIILSEIEKIVINYKDTLISLNLTKRLQIILGFFLENTEISEYGDILTEVNHGAKNIFPFDYLILGELKEENKIKVIGLDFNTDVIENRIRDFSNWCTTLKDKCQKNCILNNFLQLEDNNVYEYGEENPKDICLYEKNLLSLISPFKVIKISISKGEREFFYLCYTKEKIDFNELGNYFRTIREYFSELILVDNIIEKEKKSQEQKEFYYSLKRRITDSIWLTGKICGRIIISDSIIKLKEKDFKNWKDEIVNELTKIIKAAKETFSVHLLSFKKEALNKLDFLENEINNLIKECLEINKKISKDIIFIQFWEYIKRGVNITSIRSKDNIDRKTVHETRNLEIFKHSDIIVIKRALVDNDPKKILKSYSSSLLSKINKEINKEEDEIICSNNTLIVKSGETHYEFDWTEASNYYLYNIQIDPYLFSNKALMNIQKLFNEIELDKLKDLKLEEEDNFFIHSLEGTIQVFPEKNKSLQNGDHIIAMGINKIPDENSLNALRQYVNKLYDYVTVKKTKEMSISHSIRSGVAAIMARNGSHNIGSHILAAVGTNYNELPDDKILFKYIQHRMDFIAQVTTEIPEWTYPVLFVHDLMNRFFLQRHLLNHIAESEGLSAYEYQGRDKKSGDRKLIEMTSEIENKLIVKVKKYNGDFIISPEKNTIQNEIKDFVQVAIPGGIVGQHAFYTILENIIRNSAKHNWTKRAKKKVKNLEITIEYDGNPDKDYVRFIIWDNASSIQTSEKEAGHMLPQKNRIGKDEIPEKLPLHQEINSKLIKSFIDLETGILRNENWGLAEMKIAAGYLGKCDFNTIGDEGTHILFNENNKKKGLIRAVAVKYNENKGEYHLGYEFSVNKPKEVLIIDPDKNLIPSINISNAIKYNVYFSDVIPEILDFEFVILYKEKFSDDDVKDVFNFETYPFRTFLVTINDPTCNFKEYHRKRICWKANDKFKSLLPKNDDSEEWENFKLNIYKDWLKHQFESKFPKKIWIDLIEKTQKAATDLRLEFFLEELYGCKPENIEIFKKLLHKYDEDVETLPVIYRSKNKKRTHLPDKIISDLIIKAEYQAEANILLIRHLKFSLKGDFDYKESLSGSQIYFSMLDSGLEGYISQKFLLQILENALIKIKIIDERFNKYYIDNFANLGICHRIMSAKIFPVFRFKYRSKNLEVFKPPDERDEYYLDFDKEELDCDVLIIHQTILDTYFENDVKLMEIFLERIKKKVQLVVVTSGRGKPDKLPINAKFLPFSNLEAFLFKDHHEKFLMTQILCLLIREKEV